MKIFAPAILFLAINLSPAFGFLDGFSLENLLHAPPGLFSSDSISSNPFGDLFGGLTGGLAGLTQQLQSITQDGNAFKSLFENYKKIFNKKTPATEDNMRMGIFKSQLFNILNHNMKAIMGQSSYEKGINAFSDMTKSEVIAKFTGFARGNRSEEAGRRKRGNIAPPPFPMAMQGGRQKRGAPDSRDWRNYGVVSPVKDQGQCGSCTLFASTGALESSWALWHGGPILDLSEQELLDCIPNGNGHYGCNGNSYESTLAYQKSRGQGPESSYLYKSNQGTCKRQAAVATVRDYFQVDNNEEALKQSVGLYGPVAVAIDVDPLMDYKSGVFDSTCNGDIDHAVLAVGYGSENGKDYWLIKNSWGTSWGEKGYFKIRRNYGNLCKVADYAFFMVA